MIPFVRKVPGTVCAKLYARRSRETIFVRGYGRSAAACADRALPRTAPADLAGAQEAVPRPAAAALGETQGDRRTEFQAACGDGLRLQGHRVKHRARRRAPPMPTSRRFCSA